MGLSKRVFSPKGPTATKISGIQHFQDPTFEDKSKRKPHFYT